MPRRKNQLPIDGMPAVRARCIGCGKELQPRDRVTYKRVDLPDGRGFHYEESTRQFDGWKAYMVGPEGFHSLRCALQFAGAAYRAGFRRSR